MKSYSFFDRDLSWLGFNGRVLAEAADESLPALERINFLAIFSSNLDEFFRVRMPALLAIASLKKTKDLTESTAISDVSEQASAIIHAQQEDFGRILTQQVVPLLEKNNIHLDYNFEAPATIAAETTAYFFSSVLAYLQPVSLVQGDDHFFPENNKLYLFVAGTSDKGRQVLTIVNIPSDKLSRFYPVDKDGHTYIFFLEDIIKKHLFLILPGITVLQACSFKITRDAELNVKDDYNGDVAVQIERLLEKRDLGLATRLLYEPGLTATQLLQLQDFFQVKHAVVIQGGAHHNLKDLVSLPLKAPGLSLQRWKPLAWPVENNAGSLFDQIAAGDLVIHTPYQSYNQVLRFYNEAAIDPAVVEIYVTLYRVAHDSTICNALVSAAKNGKQVFVVVELKARFDEANNIRWAKKMIAAGVTIIYSNTSLKVHAKITLVKKRCRRRIAYYGLLATGNFNEQTARFYTDHILFTAFAPMLREMELLFIFLQQKKKQGSPELIRFEHLLVASFNLQDAFLALIEREIYHARAGKPASIIIKLNNLEERVLISKLYDASNAGVRIQLIVRSICCLVPGMPGMSQHITITRIVDRYLEHGRIFIFNNAGNEAIFMGSSDWMNRNIYRRIEVCFPVYNETIKKEILEIVQLQLSDNMKAVQINKAGMNEKTGPGAVPVQSQAVIYHLLAAKS